MNPSRTVFFVSDGTAITAEALGHSLISQFEDLAYRKVRVPFVDSAEKAEECLRRIADARQRDGARPIVVSTLVSPEIAKIFQTADAVVLNFFGAFIAPLEAEFGVKSNHTIGRSRNTTNNQDYLARIDAIDFSVAHDDGVTSRGLERADLILVGVSRSGKTPTSLYLALQFGLKAANYPLIPEDFERNRLPDVLLHHRKKLFGLTISPERLQQIRHERRPDSHYASLANCQWEIAAALQLMHWEGIRHIETTNKSIEEIAATIMQAMGAEKNGG